MKTTCTLTVALALALLVAATLSAQTFLTADTITFDPFAISTNLHRFDGETEVFAVNAGANSAFQGVTKLGDVILVADFGKERIQRFALDGTLLTPFANITNPTFLEADSADNVYTNPSILGPAVATRFDALGNVTGTFTSPINGSYSGIDADASGNVYIATQIISNNSRVIQKFAPDGTFLSSTPVNGNHRDMSIDESGELLYLADESSPTVGIQIYNLSSGAPVFTGTIPTPADSGIDGLHYAPELGTIFAVDFGRISSDPRGMQLALDGTLLATYRSAGAELAFDIVHRVPEPATWLLLVAGLGLAALRRRPKNCLARCLMVTAAAGSLLAENAVAQTVDLPGWRLVWQDEFDAAGVDTSKWQVLTRQNSYNEEKQYYSPQQASIVDGHLRITATDQPIGNKQYRSARLESWQAFGPGRFEARIDLPTGQGMWPAFWLFPNDRRIPWPTGGEIDILENRGSHPELVGSAYHWQAAPGPCCNDAHYVFGEYIALDESGLVNFHEGFHVYAAEWEEDEIRFFVDGELSFTVRETASRPVFETPKNIILNLAVGGWFGGDPDLTTVFPQVMDIDYVRVWEAVPEPSGWMLLALFSLAITCHYRTVRT